MLKNLKNDVMTKGRGGRPRRNHNYEVWIYEKILSNISNFYRKSWVASKLKRKGIKWSKTKIGNFP